VGDLAWALRAGEISALEFGDMVIKRTGVLIAVRRSKTYQDDHGQLVSVARGQRTRIGPIRVLDASDPER